MAIQFKKTFLSEIKAVSQVVKDTLNFIDKSLPNLPPEDRFDLRLMYSELLFNAVIHGNKLDSEKEVSLTVEIANGTISSKISDSGLGFDYSSLMQSFDNSKGLFGETGRGILMVNALADDLSFNGRGNEIIFHKKVAI